MKFFKKIPSETCSLERLHLNFIIKPIARDDKEDEFKKPTLVSRIINIKNRLLQDVLHRDMKFINKTGLVFFEYLQRVESVTIHEIDFLICSLEKVILILQRKKKEKIMKIHEKGRKIVGNLKNKI